MAYLDWDERRHKQDEIANVMKTVLEKRKMATAVPIPVQVLHDAELSWIEDFMHDTVLLKLESFVFEEKVSHGEETVKFHKTKFIPLPFDRIILAFTLVCIGLGSMFVAFGLPAWTVLGALVLLGAVCWYQILTSEREKAVTVSGEVTFDVDTLIRFPENRRIFPPDLGRPYKAVEVQTYTRYDDGSDEHA